MSETGLGRQMQVTVSAGALVALREVVAREENKGMAIRVVFQGFG